MTDAKRPPDHEGQTLSSFAPRPRAVRIRPRALQLAILAAAAVVAFSLAWAFVVEPRFKSQAREVERLAPNPGEGGPVRLSERVAAQPAAYDRLPPPRLPPLERRQAPAPSSTRSAPARAAPAPEPQRQATSGPSSQEQAISSDLLFAAPLSAAHAAPPEEGGQPDARRQGPPPGDVLQAGTLIPAVLLTGVDTSRPGTVVAAVSRPVYDSLSGERLLVPQGSRLIGRQAGDSVHGESRVHVVWERLILPDGASLELGGQPTVDAQGAPGAPGRVDRRLRPMAFATALAGAITTLGELARDRDGESSLIGTAGDAAAIEASRIGGRLIDRELQVRTSIRVSPGEPIRVLLTRDFVLEAWRS